MKEIDLDDIFDTTEEHKTLEQQKLKISEVVFKRLKERRLSMKKVSDNIEGLAVSQVSRIVNGENYKIHTLIKVLDFLDLEIRIVPKENKELES